MNIVWNKPDGTIAITHLVEATDPVEHASLLKQRGDIPADWVAVEFNAIEAATTKAEANTVFPAIVWPT